MPAQNRSPPPSLRRLAIERSWVHDHDLGSHIFKTFSIIWSMRIRDCWISICLNPNHLYVDLLSFSWLSTSRLIRIIRNNPTPRKPAFEWVRCGDQGDWHSLPKNKMSRPAWHDSRFEGFIGIPSSIFGVRSSKRQRWQGKNNWTVLQRFVYLVHGQMFLVLLSKHQPE